MSHRRLVRGCTLGWLLKFLFIFTRYESIPDENLGSWFKVNGQISVEIDCLKLLKWKVQKYEIERNGSVKVDGPKARDKSYE